VKITYIFLLYFVGIRGGFLAPVYGFFEAGLDFGAKHWYCLLS